MTLEQKIDIVLKQNREILKQNRELLKQNNPSKPKPDKEEFKQRFIKKHSKKP